jgi:hypothetical protein
VLADSSRRIDEVIGDDALVLDVGGWAKPFPRADWVIDLLPYASRGLYEYDREAVDERFCESTWVVRDICDHEPWPFADDQFDFAICAQTLEDVRDPIRACAELVRVAKAGYVEVPSRLEEQSLGVDGAAWAGWSHHRWLCDVGPAAIQFVHKPHFLHAKPGVHLPAGFHAGLRPEQRVACLWWEGSFEFAERVFVDGAQLDAYLAEVVDAPRSRRRRLSRARLRGGSG